MIKARWKETDIWNPITGKDLCPGYIKNIPQKYYEIISAQIGKCVGKSFEKVNHKKKNPKWTSLIISNQGNAD